MKRFLAVVRPQHAEMVCQHLLAGERVADLLVTQARGSGRREGTPGSVIDVLPKALIEGTVADEDLDEVVDTILTQARTGRPGDGKVFVWEV